MPSMPPKDTSMLDWNRNTIKIRKIRHYFFVSTNSKPDPYLGLKGLRVVYLNILLEQKVELVLISKTGQHHYIRRCLVIFEK